MTVKTVATCIAASVLGLGVFATAEPAAAADPTPADLVSALNGVFGSHPGTRAGHAKGFCLTGQFTPTPEAAVLSKAPHFAKPVAVTARFSLGGGNPQAPDNAKGNVRGMARRFDLGGGATTDLVMISAPVFFVQTPALFVEFLQTVASKDKAKLDAFFAAHPEVDATGRMAQQPSRAGKLRGRRLFRRAFLHLHQCQRRDRAGQIQGHSGRRRAGAQRRRGQGQGRKFL